MTPTVQLSQAQLDHAIEVFERRVKAKRTEADCFQRFAKACALLPGLERPIRRFFLAKHSVALLDLEELELRLLALQAAARQQRSGIVGATIVPKL